MQTNISVQIMQTSILVTRLWSKGALKEGGRRDLQKQEVICKGWLEALLQITPHTFPPLDQHRVVQIEVCIVCTEKLVCTWY